MSCRQRPEYGAPHIIAILTWRNLKWQQGGDLGWPSGVGQAMIIADLGICVPHDEGLRGGMVAEVEGTLRAVVAPRFPPSSTASRSGVKALVT